MSRYHDGIYAPVPDEVTAFDLKVEGAVPPELRGRYLRNGPNPVVAPDPRQHWFLGDGMVHGIELADGRATWYRNRYVRTAHLAARSRFEAAPGAERSPSPSNTNVIGHAGRIFALCEPDSLPFELSPELDSIGPCDFAGALQSGFTAHPKIDPVSGELHVCGYNPAEPPYLTYHVVDAAGRHARSVPIDLPRATMAHDFGLTETCAVFLDLPVRLDLQAAAGGDGFPFRWQPDTGARVGVMPRDGDSDDVQWFEIEPCYVFHPLNAYDDGDAVVIDVARYAVLHGGGEPAVGPLDEGGTTLDRWVLDRATGRAREERLSELSVEFPRVDERRVGRRHRYGYSARLVDDGRGLADPAGLVKYDLDRGTEERRELPPGGACGEPVFAPASEAAGEDEGWLLTLAHDPDRNAAELLILDATDIGGRPVAVVQIPRRIPVGFHGNWIPDPPAAA